MSFGLPLLNLSSTVAIDGAINLQGGGAGNRGANLQTGAALTQQDFTKLINDAMQQQVPMGPAQGADPAMAISLSAQVALGSVASRFSEGALSSTNLVSVEPGLRVGEWAAPIPENPLTEQRLAEQLLTSVQQAQSSVDVAGETDQLVSLSQMAADVEMTGEQATELNRFARLLSSDEGIVLNLPQAEPLELATGVAPQINALPLTQVDLDLATSVDVADHASQDVTEPVIVLSAVETISPPVSSDREMLEAGDEPVSTIASTEALLAAQVFSSPPEQDTASYRWGTESLNTPIMPSSEQASTAVTTEQLTLESEMPLQRFNSVTATVPVNNEIPQPLEKLQASAVPTQPVQTDLVTPIDETIAAPKPELQAVAAANLTPSQRQEGRVTASRGLENDRVSLIGLQSANSGHSPMSEDDSERAVVNLNATNVQPKTPHTANKGGIELITLAGPTDIAVEATEDLPEGFGLDDNMAGFDEILDGIVSKNALKLLQSGELAVPTANSIAALDNRPAANNPLAQLAIPQSVNSATWGNDVSDKVLWMAAKGVTEAEIQLDPPELGPLQARVTVHQDQAQVVFTSHSAQVREALDQQATRLREMFADEGLNLTDVDVSDQQAQNSKEQGQPGEQRAGSGLARSNAEAESSPAEQPATPVTMSQFLVDQYV